MKKIILTLGAVLAVSFANAQDKKDSGMGFAKGDAYLMASARSSSVSGGGDSTIEFSPSLGYFLSNNVSLGARFSSEKIGDVKESSFGLMAAYHFNAGNQFSSHVFLDLGMGSGTAMDATSMTLGDYKTTALSLGYGVKYFVSKHLVLNADIAALNYSSAKEDVAGAKAVNSTTVGLNMSDINLGLAYKF